MKVPLLDLNAQYQSISKEIKAAIDEVVTSQRFIMGPQVGELEKRFADYINSKYAVGVASGTDALLLSLMALGVGHGDEVITTPYTFFATAGSISRVGAKPVFVDIDPNTYNIDPALIEAKISSNTKAIIPVHLYGQCASMDSILGIASKHNLAVIEDACQSVGATYNGRPAGTMGDFGCFSFFPSKNLGCFGDGGMLTTNDEQYAEKTSKLRVHGCSQKYFHDMIGANSRLDNLQAAILIVKLKYLEDWTNARRSHAKKYNEAFSSISEIITPVVTDNTNHVYNQYMIRSNKRDAIMDSLKKNDVGCALYYPLPLHLQECYKFLGYKEGDLPESEAAAKETLSIPVYPELTEEQQNKVIDVAINALKQ
ncbi:MAG: DegT/DnrJ/EryC1/StrS family aminotransferase [Candidatus Theseobacter exili]|nr:DegT/DnrJ/EryC1/StrS family aminotransferase [Candidatus Theseobacter exili]